MLHSSGFKSVKRTAKCMHLFQFLFSKIPEDSHDHNKYLMGSLFMLGGMLKLEAKSYLNTLKKEKDSYHLVCPLFNEENPID